MVRTADNPVKFVSQVVTLVLRVQEHGEARCTRNYRQLCEVCASSYEM